MPGCLHDCQIKSNFDLAGSVFCIEPVRFTVFKG
jgi:hypothetical protein